MKIALLPLLAALAHAAPRRLGVVPGDEAAVDDDDGVVSLDLMFSPPPLVDNVPEIIHKIANVPHHVPLTDWARELMYSTQIQVGTPPQTITVHLDTGSGDLAIWNGDNCTMPECADPANQPQFHPQNSSTFKLKKAKAEPVLNYGQGFSRGVWAQDRYEGSTGYKGRNVTGLLGMSFPNISVGRQIKTNWLANAIRRFKKPMFSFYLQHTSALANETIPTSTPGGVLTLGGVNRKYFQGDIHYSDALQPLGLWRIAMDSVSLNGTVLTNGTTEAVIDTGTSLVYGPVDIVDRAMQAFPGADKYQGMWRVPCNTSASYALTFGGKEWVVPPRDFLYTASRADPSLCYTAFVPASYSFWLIGDSFLKNVYSVFEWSPARVGFAALRE